VRHALLLAQGYPIGPDHLHQAYIRTRPPVSSSEQTLSGYFTLLLTRARRGELTDARASMIEEMERELFTRAIEMAQGNQAKAARWLGVSRTTMREKLSHFGLHSPGDVHEGQ